MGINVLGFDVSKREPDKHGNIGIDIVVLIDGEPFGENSVEQWVIKF